MSAAALQYRPNPVTPADVEFAADSVTVKNAYSVGAQSYHIKFASTRDTILKLQGLRLQDVVGSLQRQMGAYLTAAEMHRATLNDPTATRFELRSNNKVSAIKGSEDLDISGVDVGPVGKVLHIAQEFHQFLATPNPTTVTPPPTPPAQPAAPKSLFDRVIAPLKLSTELNLLSLGPLPLLAKFSGLAVIISGSLEVLGHGLKSVIKFKEGNKDEGVEEIIKTLFAVSKVFLGLFLLGVFGLAATTLGPALCIIAASTNIIISVKNRAKNWEWEILRNVAMIAASIVFLTLGLSNPVTLIVIGALALIAMGAYVKANEEKGWKSWMEILFCLPFLVSIILSAMGMPYMMDFTMFGHPAAAPYGLYVSLVLPVLLGGVFLLKKCCCQKPQEINT